MHIRAADSDTRSILHPESSNTSNSWLLIVTYISAELTLGKSDAVAKSAAAGATVAPGAGGTRSFPIASYRVAGGFAFADPSPVSQVL